MIRGITTGGSSVFYYATAFDPPLETFDACGIDLRTEIDEVRNELPVQPLVVPEYRFHLVFAQRYGGTPNPRFDALGQRAEEIGFQFHCW